MMTTDRMNRRQFFEKLGKGSLVVGFSLSPMAASLAAADEHDDDGHHAKGQLTITTGPLQGAASPPTDALLSTTSGNFRI